MAKCIAVYESERSQLRRYFGWWFAALLAIAAVMAFFYFRGEGSRLPITDGLDSYLPTNAVLTRGDAFFAHGDAVFQPILGGIPRGCLPSETRILLLMYRFLRPFHAYVVTEAILRLVALLGMVLLLRRHVLPNASAVVIFGTSLCFSLLPFYVHADLSIAGQPILAYALLNVRRRDKSLHNWLIIALFPFVSSLAFVGFAIVPFVAMWIAGEFLANRKFPWLLFLALVLLAAGYCAAEHQLLLQLCTGGGFISHRAEFGVKGVDLPHALVRAGSNMVAGDAYAPSLQNAIIVPAAILGLVCALVLARREKQGEPQHGRLGDCRNQPCRCQLLLLLGLVLTCAAISSWWGVCSFRGFESLLDASGIPVLKMLQLQRLNWMHAALWTLVFAVALAMISEAFRGGRFLVFGLVVSQLIVAISAQQREHQQQRLTFAEFFSTNLFHDIREFIASPPANYRVASLGLHPAIALYSGFYMVDGYWVNYPLEYKHRFRRVIANELAKNLTLSTYFDQWGSRCYLFSAELGREYLNTKRSPKRRIECLDIDTGALAELGANYIISAVEIVNAPAIHLELARVFERDDSPWKIYLYRLNAPPGERSRQSNLMQPHSSESPLD
jgi:hypothetical protein